MLFLKRGQFFNFLESGRGTEYKKLFHNVSVHGLLKEY